MLSAPLMFALSAVPRRPAGDTFLSLSLLLNESPLRSRHSSFISTGAPFIPLTSGGLAACPCRGANITPALSVQAPSICRSTRRAEPRWLEQISSSCCGSSIAHTALVPYGALGSSRTCACRGSGLCTAVPNTRAVVGGIASGGCCCPQTLADRSGWVGWVSGTCRSMICGRTRRCARPDGKRD